MSTIAIRPQISYNQDIDRPFPEIQPRKLPPIVDAANRALRKAANRLSLSFLEDNANFLFMGDLESKEIAVVGNVR